MARLKFKLLIGGDIIVHSGLHIGGSEVDLDIGGIDKEVIKVKIGNKRIPYIPGSSLKGKLRSLIANAHGYDYHTFREANQAKKSTQKNWDQSFAALLFAGSPFKPRYKENRKGYYEDDKAMNEVEIKGKTKQLSKNTRLIIRDSYIKKGEGYGLEDKAENTINRLDGSANPRHIERVTKGTTFSLDMIMDIYEGDEAINLLQTLDLGFQLLKKDYLGGSGTRGYGKVDIENLSIQQIAFNKDGSISENKYADYTFKSNNT